MYDNIHMNNQYFPEKLKKYFDNKFNEQIDIIISTVTMLEYKYYVFCDSDEFEIRINRPDKTFILISNSWLKDPKAFDIYVYEGHKYVIGRRLSDDNFDDLLNKVLEIL